MESKEKKKRLIVEVTPEQWEMIQTKMAQVGTTNFARYARKMLIDGYVIHQDYGDIKALTRELAALGRNLNQIAFRVNERRSIYAAEVEDIRKIFRHVRKAVSERLVKLSGEGEEQNGLREVTAANQENAG